MYTKTKLLLLLLFGGLLKACTLYDSTYDSTSKIRHARDISTNCGPDDIAPPNRVNTTEQLLELRELMIVNNLAAYIVPIDDEGRLGWISGFSGSAGEAAITLDEARLWTDGRYFLQGSQQLDCNWSLMRMGSDGVPEMAAWVADTLKNMTDSGRVGADPEMVGAGTWLEWQETLEKSGSSMVKMENFVDILWTEANGRPPPVEKEIVVHGVEWAGETWQDKVSRLREKLLEDELTGMIISELDEIAWTFNLRATGPIRSPTFASLALLTMDEIILWIQLDKLTDEVSEHLTMEGCTARSACVQIKEVEDSLMDLEAWFTTQGNETKILVSAPSIYLPGANFALYSVVPPAFRNLLPSPVLDMKSVKNEVEIEGMLNAQIRDSAALCDWAAFMEEEIQERNANWTEISAATALEQYRRLQKDNRGLSFGTISAYGSNGAVIHYRPAEDTNKIIARDNLYLVDSGGQYLDGTTDVTRTFHYGQPTQEQIDRYTDVLRGAIDLALVRAPEGTLDSSIDLVTRQFLYKHGLDYRHGTGHGIGSYLQVHEGPTRITMKREKPAGMKVGMFFSDEPGYYKDGEFGIRLETILRVVPLPLDNPEFGTFMQFEPVTLVPFEPKLIDFNALSPDQTEWLRNYNALIEEKIASRLEAEENWRALDWVRSRLSV